MKFHLKILKYELDPRNQNKNVDFQKVCFILSPPFKKQKQARVNKRGRGNQNKNKMERTNGTEEARAWAAGRDCEAMFRRSRQAFDVL